MVKKKRGSMDDVLKLGKTVERLEEEVFELQEKKNILKRHGVILVRSDIVNHFWSKIIWSTIAAFMFGYIFGYFVRG